MSGRFSNVNAILIVGHSGNEKVYHQHHIPCKIETTLYARRERHAKRKILYSRKSLQRTDRGAGWPPAVEAGEVDCQLRSADYR